jgi:ceramide glucosyltransferase
MFARTTVRELLGLKRLRRFLLRSSSIGTGLTVGLPVIRWIFLLPALGGSVFSLLCLWAIFRFRRRKSADPIDDWPPVSILKPVHGLEKNLLENLRSACLQDYPAFEVVFSVQRRNDPAVPVLGKLAREFGPDRVRVVIEEMQPGTNGKINNMSGALPHARYDVLVISDSDVRLPSGYLRAIVAPLSETGIGFVCTPYRAARATRWFEKMELLSLNADFMPSVVFAYETGASLFCLGASIAVRRDTLKEIGGLESLADYLVEDYEMGRRIVGLGRCGLLVPPVVDTMVDLQTPAEWWSHQVYWDQNTRAARPIAFFCTVLIRAVPFALLFALLRPTDPFGWGTLAAVVAIRLATAAVIMGWGLGDREGVRALPLLPLRDVAGLASWMLAFVRRTTTWRGTQFALTRDGRLVSN